MAREWWWKRSHARFYGSARNRDNPYALNAGTSERFHELVKELEALLRPAVDDRVLDLGGGNGLLSRRVFSQCRRLVVMDFCRSPLAVSASTGAANASWVVGDMKHPPFRGDSFTILFTYSTFPHLGSERRAKRILKRWDRLLAQGGVLFIGDIPDRRAIWRVLLGGLSGLRNVKGAKFYFAILMQSFYSRRGLLTRLAQLGYEARVVEQLPGRRFAGKRFDVVALKCRSEGNSVSVAEDRSA